MSVETAPTLTRSPSTNGQHDLHADHLPPPHGEGRTVTKKELIDRIAERTGHRRCQVKDVVQLFLDEVVEELADGNRLEFRDFGVFETRTRKARRAQNPKTLQPVAVPEKRTVKFKVGRLLKTKLERDHT